MTALRLNHERTETLLAKVLDVIDNVPVTTRQTRTGTNPNFSGRKTSLPSHALSASIARRGSNPPVNPSLDIGRPRRGTTDSNATDASFTTAPTSFPDGNTGNKSFASATSANTSFTSSVLSERPSDEASFSTQTSVMDFSFQMTGSQDTSGQYDRDADHKLRLNAFSRLVEEVIIGVPIDKSELSRPSTNYGSPIDEKETEETFGHLPSNLRDVSLQHTGAPEIDSSYRSSLDFRELDHSVKSPPQELLRERLQGVFPVLPASLEKAPLAFRYEITRVCLYAKVPTIDVPSTIKFSDLANYDTFWRYLTNHPALKGRPFPEKSNREAWISSLDTFSYKFHSVVMSAKLSFNDSQAGPFFEFQLQPLKSELSHRLGRRFGHDRFLEISLPSFSGSKLPKLLKDSEAIGCGDECRKLITEWFVRSQHSLLGISWCPFFVKDAKKRKTKLSLSHDDETNNSPSQIIHFFATDGIGFQAAKTIPLKGESFHQHTKMSVAAMMNWLIPLAENKEQSYLKLFSRFSLGLSKTWKSIELDESQILYREKNLLSTDEVETMNDGCGRLSRKLASNVAAVLGLTYVPSTFQARIGGAKGLWVIDVNESSEQQWIEVYPSQLKWKRDAATSVKIEADHTTFEVLGWVKPLKPAALNLQFLPILEDRGRSRAAMRDAISRLLVNGLDHEISEQRNAMNSPQSFRKWIREHFSSIQERIRHNSVPFRAGLPDSLEEQVNMLLDAGFNPNRLQFLKDLALKTYKTKCSVLKKKLCYAKNNVRDYNAVFLSTLLSDLVDQAKQGYTFTIQDWRRMQERVIKDKVMEPCYKRDSYDGRGRPEHIIDHLKFTVAEETIEKTLTAFHSSLQAASYWDEDLVRLKEWAKNQAEHSPDFQALLKQLEEDILSLRSDWEAYFSKRSDVEGTTNFASVVTSFHERFLTINPAPTNPLSITLLPSCFPNVDFSMWSLLRASVAFSTYRRSYVSNFVWWMAGKQLAYLKALFGKGFGRGGGQGAFHPVISEMYAMLRPDSTFVELMQNEDRDPRRWEAEAESVILDEEQNFDD